MDIIEELSYEGIKPAGPCSAWPYERNERLMDTVKTDWENKYMERQHAKKVNVGVGKMAAGLLKTAKQAVVHGKVSEEIREERYDTCKSCPFFVEDSKRCSECGCFMEAKTWVGGDPDMLCPKKKWSR